MTCTVESQTMMQYFGIYTRKIEVFKFVDELSIDTNEFEDRKIDKKLKKPLAANNFIQIILH